MIFKPKINDNHYKDSRFIMCMAFKLELSIRLFGHQLKIKSST